MERQLFEGQFKGFFLVSGIHGCPHTSHTATRIVFQPMPRIVAVGCPSHRTQLTFHANAYIMAIVHNIERCDESRSPIQPQEEARCEQRFMRISTTDQHIDAQLYDLRLARQRGFEVQQEYRDVGISGRKARRPELDTLMADARQKKFSVVLVAAFDRVARSTRHFLQVVDELDSLGVVFLSRRENIDTSGPMGRLFVTLISSIAELEADLIRERVLAGMRRAKLDGVRMGGHP